MRCQGACSGGRCRGAANDDGLAGAAEGSGLVLAWGRTLSRHRRIPSLHFSPVVSGRSTGRWEEQLEDGGIIECCSRSKPAELPGILDKGEMSAGKGDEASGALHRRGQKNTKRGKQKGSLHVAYIYAFSRRFYPKRLTVHSGYTFFFCQYMCSLGIEPTTFALLTQCSNH